MAAEEDHALPDTHNANLQTRPSQMSSRETLSAPEEEPSIQHQEGEGLHPPQRASPTRWHLERSTGTYTLHPSTSSQPSSTWK